MDLLRRSDPWDLPSPAAGLPPLDPDQLARQRPDLHLAHPEGRGRLSLWWTDVPAWPGHRLGALGHFAADGEALSADLLDAGCAELARRGCTLAVGPMDGNTWRSYRFMTEAGDHPPFALEPWNPEAWPRWWEAAGFRPFQGYQSALETRLESDHPRLPQLFERLEGQGVRLRPLDPEDFDGELGRIYEVSAAAFTANVLYTPLPEAEFRAMYQRIRPYVQPRLVWMAEHGERPVGYVFTVPDLLQAQRGGPVDTLVVKTLAKVPDRFAGLGKALLAKVQGEARALGFTRAIHALMHDANRSTGMGEDSRVIRRYTLYARELS